MLLNNGKTLYFSSANNFYNAIDAMELAKQLEIDMVKDTSFGTHWIKLMYKGKQLCPFDFYEIQHVHSFLYGIYYQRELSGKQNQQEK